MGAFDNVGGATTITDVLNIWNEIGVFSYVIPFLLIFAIVYAILQRSKILSDENNENKPILAIIAVSSSLLSLQFDFVSEFFAIIFPRFGMGISILLVAMIFIRFFSPDDDKGKKAMSAVGWLVGVSIIVWALSEWDDWSSQGGFGYWFSEYFWSIVVLGIIIFSIVWATGGSGKKGTNKETAG